MPTDEITPTDAATPPKPSTKSRCGPVNTVSNNTSALTEGDLARARAKARWRVARQAGAELRAALTSCKLCGGTLSPHVSMPLDAMKDILTPFDSVLRCGDCETGMIFPQPTPDEVATFYQLDSYYTHGASHIRPIDPDFLDRALVKLAWWSDRPKLFDVDKIAKLLPPGASICDLGCGDAVLLKGFKDLGFDVLGVDPDASARVLAAESGITVLAGTAEDPGTDRQFDLVIMTHSLEHCIDPTAAIKNAYRMTKPGGYFYCEVPNSGCWHFEMFTVCSAMFDSPRHLWFFVPKSLRRAIEAGGFKFDSWRFAGFVRHHEASWRAWETTIFNRLSKLRRRGPERPHTFLRSLWLLALSAFAPDSKKYDSVGVLSRRE